MKRQDDAVVVLRDAAFDCVGTLSNVCGGPEDACAPSAFDMMRRLLDVLDATNGYDATNRRSDVWRGEAALRLAVLKASGGRP